MSRFLVVAATAAEAAYLPPDVPLLVTGLGKTAAAAALARALASYDDLADLEVINLGTAGALHDHHEGLHEIGTVINHDINADAVRALGYDPRERIRCGEGRTVLASGDVFVTEPEVRTRLAEQADLVDMEGYAVAYVAELFGVRARLVKHVSDQADEGALDWPARVDASARVLSQWLTGHLASQT